MSYGYKKEVKGNFEGVVIKTKEALAEEGFGILTEADIQKALQTKLGVDYDRYVILGACNPPFAYKALSIDREIGLLLPCNVIVYEENDTVYVSAIMPTVAMSAVDAPEMEEIAKEVEDKLRTVIDTVSAVDME